MQIEINVKNKNQFELKLTEFKPIWKSENGIEWKTDSNLFGNWSQIGIKQLEIDFKMKFYLGRI